MAFMHGLCAYLLPLPCRPVMVSVAKNFDAPIKLLFPRLGLLDSGKRPFSMLVSVRGT